MHLPETSTDAHDAFWAPSSDVPNNLGADGQNYVEWMWSLLDNGIDVDPHSLFALLFTQGGQQLPTLWTAGYPDEQLSPARAALERGRDLNDVVLCCKAMDKHPANLVDELVGISDINPAAEVARAKSIGEICGLAEDFWVAALDLKLSLSVDERLPKPVRVPLNGAHDVP